MPNEILDTLCFKASLINDKVFAKTAWKGEMEKLGLFLTYLGADLDRFRDDGSISPVNDDKPSSGQVSPAYIALGLVAAEVEIPISEYEEGFPHRELFFASLRPWKWSNFGRREILVEGVELNISEYYKVPKHAKVFNSIDGHRLTRERPNAAQTVGNTNKHYTYAVIDGDASVKSIDIFRYSKNRCVLVLVGMGKTRTLWAFCSSLIS